MSKTTILLVIVLVCSTLSQDCIPFGVRLNYGPNLEDPEVKQKLAIRFDTPSKCARSYITVQRFGSSITKTYCDSTEIKFTNSSTFVHKCPITDLNEGEEINYMVVGWTGNQTDPQIPYRDKPISYYYPKPTDQFKLICVADWSFLRVKNYTPLDESFNYLLKNDKAIRGIFINGDIAYDLETNDGRNYRDFMVMLSQVAIQWPVIMNPGNHQHVGNNTYIMTNSFELYSSLTKRVTYLRFPFMSFVMFDPYLILYKNENQNVSLPDFTNFLDRAYQSNQLIVTASHYPFKCSGQDVSCTKKPDEIKLFFDSMFEHNTAFYLGAHYHSYQRNYPFKLDGTFVKSNGPYTWSPAIPLSERIMLSVLQGVAGNDKSIVEEQPQGKDFTASLTYNVTGFGMLEASQSTLTYKHFTTQDYTVPFDMFEMQLIRTAAGVSLRRE